MTTLFVRGSRFFVGIPRRRGGWVKRATGTMDKTVARRMANMIDELGPRGRRDWELLEAIVNAKLSVSRLYDAYVRDQLDELRAQLTDIDLEPHVADWLTSTRSSLAPDTLEHYELYVRSLFTAGERFSRSDLTTKRLAAWLASRQVGPSTKRKYHAAVSGFCDFLRRLEILERNPMRDVKAPPPAPARMEYLETPDAMREVADEQPEPFRTISLLMHATGLEVSVAIGLRKADIDFSRREVRARGTKTAARDRIATIGLWAWPDVRRYIRRANLTPRALLFPMTGPRAKPDAHVTRWAVADAHRAACAALKIENYQLRDSRHSYAVRAIRAGASFELVARQLGHANTSMVVKVYARFRVSESERIEWETEAAKQDRARAVR